MHAPNRQGWLRFSQPLAVLAAGSLADVPVVLREVQRQTQERGRWAAGFLSYEAAPALDPAMQVSPPDPDFPLAWFAIYAPPELLPAGAVRAANRAANRAGSGPALLPGPWQPLAAQDSYRSAVGMVKAHIAAGDTYQVNLTYRLLAQHDPSRPLPPPWPAFTALADAHHAPYAAFLDGGSWALCSISPECFFTLDGSTLTTRPMKGTAPRGVTLEADQAAADWLRSSEKNRAENLMIVDMARNDLGRVARTGSVRVTDLFTVEKHSTVWQMTSGVQAETGADLPEIFQCLFPAASITGAPKLRTMQIIAALENTPRQAYTGAVGFVGPGRQAQFNVAIRTLQFDANRQQARYGVGGGIVWDSEPSDEWQETLAKARILHEPPQPFDLLETLRWTPHDGWFLLEQHARRLARSAEYFGFPFDRREMLAALGCAAAGAGGAALRARLLLSPDGEMRVETQPLAQGGSPLRVALARSPVASGDRFLYHKTTCRARYQQALAECPGFDDVLLWNERGEVTESTIANLFARIGGRLVTPPLECGLLPGTYRAWMLETGQAAEAVIRKEDLQRCEQVLLANAVRGMWPVQVVDAC